MKNNRRALMGWLVDPQRALHLSFFSLGGGIVVSMFFTLYLLFDLDGVVDFRSLQDLLPNLELNIAAISLALVMFSVIVGVQLNHRISGPILQFRKHVARLESGDYSTRIQLRDQDHFTEMAEDLNNLAASLAAERS